MASAPDHDGSDGWSMIVVDLDEFRRINDAFGTAGGDATLRAVGATLGAITPSDAAVGRLSADEFAILVPGQDPDRAQQVAFAAVAAVRELLDAGPSLGRLSLRASAGIAFDTDEGPEALDRLAGKALTAVGQAQRNRRHVTVFDPRMVDEASTDLSILRDLQHALEAGSDQIEPAFQPIIDLRTGDAVAVESLARWTRPDGTLLAPERYLGLAEASGWIGALSQRMLRRSCEELVRLRSHHPDLRVHVNVSPIEAAQDSFVQATRATIERAGLPLDAVVLEVTEQVLLPESGAALDAFMALADAGVMMALDDFGSGYASVGYLARLRLDYIKVDRGFTAELGTEDALLEDLLPFLAARGATVIAEGVESAGQLSRLRDLDCAMAQGFLLGRPTTAKEVVRLTAGGV